MGSGLLKPFRRTRPRAAEVADLEDACANVFADVRSRTLLGGQLVEAVSLTTTARAVPHGLKVKPTGYVVVRSNAAATVYDTGTADLNTIELVASATVTVSLWFF